MPMIVTAMSRSMTPAPAWFFLLERTEKGEFILVLTGSDAVQIVLIPRRAFGNIYAVTVFSEKRLLDRSGRSNGVTGGNVNSSRVTVCLLRKEVCSEWSIR